MEFYLAGNFPQLAKPELEKECKLSVEKRYGEYHRLVSFFFKDDCETVIRLKKEDENKGENDGN
jgi:hypothetical protein